MATPQARKGAPGGDVDYEIEEENEYYITRPHTSARRYRQPVQRDTWDDYAPEQAALTQRRRASSQASISGIATRAPSAGVTTRTPQRASASQVATRNRRRRPPWLAVCTGMLIMLLLVVGSGYFTSWWQLHQNDTTYGRPRTSQVNAIVGHNDNASKPSHFIFMNLNSRVIVVEFPGGDSAHALIYTGPTLFGPGSDLIPVTGEFRDVNGDGRPDLLVHIQDQTIVFLNDGSKFRPLQPGEHITP